MKKYDIFSPVFGIANQLLTRPPPFEPLRLVDEWTAKPSPFSVQGRLSEFFRIMAAKHSKIRVANRQWRSHFPRRWRNQNTKRKTESYEFSGFRILSIGINSITVDFAYWELRPAKKGLFCCDSTHVFILSAPTHFTNFIWGLSILLFSIINKVDFSCQWRTIVFIWQKKKMHGCS